MLNWARTNQCAFTLATPVLIEPRRVELANLLATLMPAFSETDELVISDWGVLELARAVNPNIPIVIGRTLSGQKRDPRTPTLGFDSAELKHFRSSSWHAAPAVAMLQDLRIARVEFDNLWQGLEPLPTPLRGTVHTPYAMVASSRNCPFRLPGVATPCPQPCGEAFSLTRDDLPSPLLQGGNTQFVKVPQLPPDLLARGIDRVVEHLDLPH